MLPGRDQASQGDAPLRRGSGPPHRCLLWQCQRRRARFRGDDVRREALRASAVLHGGQDRTLGLLPHPIEDLPGSVHHHRPGHRRARQEGLRRRDPGRHGPQEGSHELPRGDPEHPLAPRRHLPLRNQEDMFPCRARPRLRGLHRQAQSHRRQVRRQGRPGLRLQGSVRVPVRRRVHPGVPAEPLAGCRLDEGLPHRGALPLRRTRQQPRLLRRSAPYRLPRVPALQRSPPGHRARGRQGGRAQAGRHLRQQHLGQGQAGCNQGVPAHQEAGAVRTLDPRRRGDGVHLPPGRPGGPEEEVRGH